MTLSLYMVEEIYIASKNKDKYCISITLIDNLQKNKVKLYGGIYSIETIYGEFIFFLNKKKDLFL